MDADLFPAAGAGFLLMLVGVGIVMIGTVWEHVSGKDNFITRWLGRQ